MVEGHQVIPGDSGNRRGRTLSAKWMVRSIQQFSELPPGNPCGVVVSPSDSLQRLALRQLHFAGFKSRVAQEISKDCETFGKILLQDVERRAAAFLTDA